MNFHSFRDDCFQGRKMVVSSSRLSFGPLISSQIVTWRCIITYECLDLSYIGTTSPFNLIIMFLFIYVLHWDFLPFFHSVCSTPCLAAAWLLSGWLSPSLSFSLILFSIQPRFLLLFSLSAAITAYHSAAIQLWPFGHWPFSF